MSSDEVLEDDVSVGEEANDAPEPQKPEKKRGVVYLSKLPAGMKPSQLKQIMGDYGKVERMWCVPIDKSGKANSRSAMEAWVEFKTRKRARRIAEALNCQPVGRGRYKECLWNIKYLKGFTWQDLMSQQLHHKKMREQRLRQRVEHAKRAVNFYLDQKAKQDSDEKKGSKRKRQDDAVEEHPERHSGDSIKRVFNQTPKLAEKEVEEELDDDFLKQILGRTDGKSKKAKIL